GGARASVERRGEAWCLKRRQPADPDLLRDEDRAALVRTAERAHGAALRRRRARLEVPGAAGPDPEPLLAELRTFRLTGQPAADELEDEPRRVAARVHDRPSAASGDRSRS